MLTGWVNEGKPRPHLADGSGAKLPDCPRHVECKQKIAAGLTDEIIVRWDEVRAMAAAGTFEFHSHTHTHTRWDKIFADEAKNAAMAQELQLSRQFLLEQLGEVSAHLCWPQGYFDSKYVRLAQDAGFQYFYTVDALGFNLPDTPVNHIYRYAVRNKGVWWFGLRLLMARNVFFGRIYIGYKRWRAQWRAGRKPRKVNA